MFTRNFRIFEWSVVAVSLLLLSTAYALSADIPVLHSYVNDYANILPDNYKHDLNQRLSDFEKKTKGNPQIVVVTVPNTGDESIEEFANKTFHQNKIGHKDNNNGVLAIISMDHHMRIEVGYDLEPTLTDTKSAQILDSIKPDMKAGNYPKALDSEVSQLIPIVSAGSAENVVTTNQNPPTNHHSTGFPFMSLLILILIGVGVYFYVRKRKNEQSNPTLRNDQQYPDTYNTTYTPPASPDYSRSQSRTWTPPTYPSYSAPRRQGPFNPPPAPTPYVEPSYTPPASNNSGGSMLKSAAAGAAGGFIASELLNSGNRRRDDDDSSSSSSSWSSPSSDSSSSDSSSSWSDSSSSSSDSGYSGGGGDSGGGGSSSDW